MACLICRGVSSSVEEHIDGQSEVMPHKGRNIATPNIVARFLSCFLFFLPVRRLIAAVVCPFLSGHPV